LTPAPADRHGNIRKNARGRLSSSRTRFIACPESLANDEYRDPLVRASVEDVPATAAVTGVTCSWLTESLPEAGFDDLTLQSTAQIDFSDVHGERKPWKDIHGAGQGVGQIDRIGSVQHVADQIARELPRRRLIGYVTG
jgi:nitronate monooxygenase